VNLIRNNSADVINVLGRFDALHLGLACAVLGLFISATWRPQAGADVRWQWGGAVVLCLAAPYLPVFAADQRYFYPSYPFLVAAGLGLIVFLTRGPEGRNTLRTWIGFALIGISFLWPSVQQIRTQLASEGIEKANRNALLAQHFADRLKAAGVVGPIAESNMVMLNEGLYIAFFLGTPYHGRNANADADSFRASLARIAIVERGHPLTESLDADSAFRDLDDTLFDDPRAASTCPVKLYEVRTRASHR
jgi:hypothetical protein